MNTSCTFHYDDVTVMMH